MLRKVEKVYWFWSSFYVELKDSQKKSRSRFSFFLYFFIIASYAVWSVITTFIPEKFVISPLQVKIYFTYLIVIIYILLHYIYQVYGVDTNNKIDIEDESDERQMIPAKVVDFWLAREMMLWGFQMKLNVIVQYPYKNKPLRSKLVYPINYLPTQVTNLAIDDMIVKNLRFLYNRLVLWNKNRKPPIDEQKKHELHKSMPQAIWIGKDAQAYMHKTNQHQPYVNLDIHALFPPVSMVTTILEFIRKLSIAVVHLYAMWLFFSLIFSLLLAVFILLGM